MKSNINAQNHNKVRKKLVIQFLTIFLLIVGIYYVLLLTFEGALINYYISITAKIAGIALSLFTNNVEVVGGIISAGNSVVVLSFGCEGSEPIVLYFAAVMAFPVLLKYKLYGLVIGISFLYFLNILRILFLFLILETSPDNFEILHSTILPIIFIIIAMFLWLMWLKYLPKLNEKANIK